MALHDGPTALQGADKKQIAYAFSRAAHQYNHIAEIQHTIALEALTPCANWQNMSVLDIGCGTGRHTHTLAENNNTVMGVDLAQGMLDEAKKAYPTINFRLGDAEALPLKANTFDAVFSSMALQWSLRPDAVMREIARVTKKRGQIALAIMVAGSFSELSQARKRANLPCTENNMCHAHAWLDASVANGMVINAAKVVDYIDTFENVFQLLRSIKGVGAGTLTSSQRVSLSLTRTQLNQLQQAYSQLALERGSRTLPLTYSVLHLSLENRTA